MALTLKAEILLDEALFLERTGRSGLAKVRREEAFRIMDDEELKNPSYELGE